MAKRNRIPALAAAWGMGCAAGDENRGAMVALDEVEWIPRPNSPSRTTPGRATTAA